MSLTCICCLTLEHILVSNIVKHLALDSILADCQHGFRSRKSCETLLVQFVHNNISNLDGAVADRFDHNGFCKGQWQGTTQEAITQISLLWDKRVHPQLDQFMALWAHSTSSIRWSSLRSCPSVIRCTPRISFRTILFLIFINDLPDNIRSSVHLFANDCVLYRNIYSIQDCFILQEDLTSLGQYGKPIGK